MSESEKIMKRLLEDLNIPMEKVKGMNYPQIEILECESVIDDGYEELIGKIFSVDFYCEDKVAIEYENNLIWFKDGEYKKVENNN